MLSYLEALEEFQTNVGWTRLAPPKSLRHKPREGSEISASSSNRVLEPALSP